MTIQEELNTLLPLLGTDDAEFYSKAKALADKCRTDEDRQVVARFIAARLEQADRQASQLEEKAVRLQMQEVSDVISLSYLAKHYFNKSRAWLYQRMNGNLVNGKPARFTDEELATLNKALKDIAEKLASVHIS